jgi:hypothetical protein
VGLLSLLSSRKESIYPAFIQRSSHVNHSVWALPFIFLANRQEIRSITRKKAAARKKIIESGRVVTARKQSRRRMQGDDRTAVP